MVRHLIRACLFTVAIPVLGYLIGSWIISDVNADLAKDGVTIAQVCEFRNLTGEKGIEAACYKYRQIWLLRESSIWAGVVALALMGIYFVASLICGKNRKLMAAIFPKLVPFSLLVISVLVLVQGAILTYAVYISQVYVIERVFIWLVGLIGLGAVVGAFKLISATLSINKPLTQPTFAKQVDEQKSGKLLDFIEQIADEIGATRPNNIIVGLEPTFYATAANVNVLNEGKELSGETMYLSLPLMRLFNTEELRAVIGHELGHFRGDDTAYSLRFAPVYRGLSNAISSLDVKGDGLSSFAKLPAISMLSLVFEMFARNERGIRKIREFEADMVGVRASSAEALATALGKVAVYAPLWAGVREQNVDRLNAGKVTANLSQVYEDSARFDVAHQDIRELVDEILSTAISHPTDKHPTLDERFRNIKFDAGQLTVEMLTERGNSSVELFDNLTELEEELSLDEHRLMVALGAVEPPEEEEDEDEATITFLNAMYSLAAAMIGDDGKILQSEIEVAETIAAIMFSEFDPVEFRSYCNNLSDLPAFTDVIDILGPALNVDQKDAIYGYLNEIALADGELTNDEKELLLYTRRKWDLEV